MLVNLNFITSPDWALRGVSLNFKETMFDYIGECTLVNATLIQIIRFGLKFMIQM